MNVDLKFWAWDRNQWQAAGKHGLSFVAGGVAIAATLHFISPQDATNLTDNFNDVYNGTMQVVKGIAGILAVLTPIYTSLKAAQNASQSSSIKRVETIAASNTDASVEAKQALVTATNSLPEVQGVVTKPTAAGVALAESVPSETVVPSGTPEAAKIGAG